VARLPPDPDVRRERTLLVALLLSAWAPFVTGWAVVLSQSTTQVADFVRRTVELVAIAVAWAVFRRLRGVIPRPATRVGSSASRPGPSPSRWRHRAASRSCSRSAVSTTSRPAATSASGWASPCSAC
jgi:hypothetical protein